MKVDEMKIPFRNGLYFLGGYSSGGFSGGHGREIHCGLAELQGWGNHTMIDSRTIIASTCEYEGELTFGAASFGFLPSAIELGRLDVAIDRGEGKTLAEVKALGMEMLADQLAKLGLSDEYPVLVNHFGPENKFLFSFHSPALETLGFQVMNNFHQPRDHAKSFTLLIGKSKGRGFKSGSRASWGYKWSRKPKDAIRREETEWKDVKARLMEMHAGILDWVFEETTEQKRVRGMEASK
jgi:hypothetical protein